MKLKNLYNLEKFWAPELERSFNPQESHKIIDSYLKSSELTCEIVVSDNNYETSHIALFKSNGQFIARGSGKGKHHLLGAYAETLEHFISEHHDSELHEKHTLKNIADQPSFKKDPFIQKLLQETPESLIRTKKFNDFTHEQYYWVPAAYVDPFTYNKEFVLKKLSETEKNIAKFASNNGSALGLNIKDSLLHGLNECIERHYMSLFCQNIIGHKTSALWKIYNDGDGVSYNKKKDLIEQRFGRVITVYAQTIFDSYVAFSMLSDNQKHHLEVVGGGSSLYLPLAIQRSIDELAQSQIIMENVAIDELTIETKKTYQLLYAYEGLKPLIFLSRKKINSIASQAEKSPIEEPMPANLTPSEQVEYLVKNIKKQGYTPMYRVLASKNGIWITQVFVPGFDSFHLIRKGIFVAPLDAYDNKNNP